MNTKFKNVIVATGFLGCTLVLTAIVSLGTSTVNQTKETNVAYLTKAKITEQTVSPLNQDLLK
ncbi:hypothetical protein H1R17_00690 [Flavobacterium sp. xlx-214]|uniref:hypothetical protein n=1 Tax=unclassified Flavobacterium TaxID=196869 RepID=UPI0013D09526|nr:MULTISPECIES: hypothetical protein [unclassified Flavobacterium]MBA5794068.1 hypothetical protein [Flavobacterium sp. xlx-221]QMI83693.1 hypothetical protein H1R17_00690 [Flavobacterium sp. xlx-214]